MQGGLSSAKQKVLLTKETEVKKVEQNGEQKQEEMVEVESKKEYKKKMDGWKIFDERNKHELQAHLDQSIRQVISQEKLREERGHVQMFSDCLVL